ncbi:MAG: NUDIX hydrolase [Clostridium sp.]
MIKVNTYELNSIENEKLIFAVIIARFREKWLYVKHKKRSTWEIPGGKREAGEDIIETARRELFEETGAKKFKLEPICIYEVEKDDEGGYRNDFGQVFFAEIEELDILPLSEIGEVKLFSKQPKNLTYPSIQPYLYEKAIQFLEKVE